MLGVSPRIGGAIAKGGDNMSSLSALSGALAMLDDDLAPEDFDPSEAVGELRDKIDAIKWRLDSWEAHAQAIEENWLKPLAARRKSLLSKAEKLREYTAFIMQRDNIKTLPGNAFRVDLRAYESIDVLAAPTASEALQYKPLVKTTITYAWDKKELKPALKEGLMADYAKIKTTYAPKFEVKK